MRKAGALLARRAYSRAELRVRLERTAAGYSVEPVLDRLEQLNLLNDSDYAYNFALCRIREQGWGPGKVRNSLLRRQIEPAVIEGALDRVRREVGDERALALCIRKYCGNRGLPADSKGWRKLILHLHRHGFNEETIEEALPRMIPAEIRRRFETGE